MDASPEMRAQVLLASLSASCIITVIQVTTTAAAEATRMMMMMMMMMMMLMTRPLYTLCTYKSQLFLNFPRSGIRYNRGGCTLRHCGEPLSDQNLRLGLDDPRLEILHFMGAALSLLGLHHYLSSHNHGSVENCWSPILVSFHLGWFSIESWLREFFGYLWFAVACALLGQVLRVRNDFWVLRRSYTGRPNPLWWISRFHGWGSAWLWMQHLMRPCPLVSPLNWWSRKWWLEQPRGYKKWEFSGKPPQCTCMFTDVLVSTWLISYKNCPDTAKLGVPCFGLCKILGSL